jgi:hypothetical protein
VAAGVHVVLHGGVGHQQCKDVSGPGGVLFILTGVSMNEVGSASGVFQGVQQRITFPMVVQLGGAIERSGYPYRQELLHQLLRQRLIDGKVQG